MIVFKYKDESLGQGRGVALRPVADVYLKSKTNSWIEFHPYIDSGADVTMIPLTLGRLIGFQVNREEIEQVGGISGSVPIINTKVQIKIGGVELMVRVAWALTENVPPLLGRTDVFDVFDVTFKQSLREIIFQKHL